MQLCNNTPQQLFYSIGSPGSADCGTINAGDTTDLPAYDNTTNVSVSFQVTGGTPTNSPPFSITIPSSGVGMAVTLGIYVE